MQCKYCKSNMVRDTVKVWGAENTGLGNFCKECGYFELDKKSMKKVIKELKLREAQLNIEQKVTKISQNRLGIYFNKDVLRCTDLKPGQSVYVNVPDKKHIVITIAS